MIYFVVIESSLSSTLGHYILGLKVITNENKRINFLHSLKRHLVDPIDFLIFGLPALISISNTQNHQRLGDLWAKTFVVKDIDD